MLFAVFICVSLMCFSPAVGEKPDGRETTTYQETELYYMEYLNWFNSIRFCKPRTKVCSLSSADGWEACLKVLKNPHVKAEHAEFAFERSLSIDCKKKEVRLGSDNAVRKYRTFYTGEKRSVLPCATRNGMLYIRDSNLCEGCHFVFNDFDDHIKPWLHIVEYNIPAVRSSIIVIAIRLVFQFGAQCATD